MKLGILTLCMMCVAASPAFAETKEPAVPVRTVSPDYPDNLRRAGVSGVVVLLVDIDDQGNVVSVAVDRASHTDLEKPAMTALKKWRFKPARQDGNPVASKLTIPIKFNIQD